MTEALMLSATCFNVPLVLLAKKGHGPDFDFWHLHYRSSAIALTLGAEPIDLLRQMRSTRTDPYSRGRNFVNHFAIKAWNIVPVTPTIETQYTTVIGTAWQQRRHGGDGVGVWVGRRTDALTVLTPSDRKSVV